MTTHKRIEGQDALYKLLTNLPGAAFGAAPECSETAPDLFFPEPGRFDLARQAKAICVRCPVRDACLELALRDGEWGVWGGTTERERRTIRAERRVAAAGSEQAGEAA